MTRYRLFKAKMAAWNQIGFQRLQMLTTVYSFHTHTMFHDFAKLWRVLPK